MNKKTQFDKIKDVAITLLYVEPEETEFDFLLIHPFLNNRYMYFQERKELVDILSSTKEYINARNKIKTMIDHAQDIWQIQMYMNKPYRTLFFKLINEYLSEKDYNDMLSSVWIDTENVNQDANVSIEDWIKFFKKANKSMLMNEEELNVYNNLPDNEKILVLRGVGKDRNPKGLSWTNSMETATWFAKRWKHEEDAYILKGYVYKKDIFAYFNERGENELVTNSKKVIDIERISLV